MFHILNSTHIVEKNIIADRYTNCIDIDETFGSYLNFKSAVGVDSFLELLKYFHDVAQDTYIVVNENTYVELFIKYNKFILPNIDSNSAYTLYKLSKALSYCNRLNSHLLNNTSLVSHSCLTQSEFDTEFNKIQLTSSVIEITETMQYIFKKISMEYFIAHLLIKRENSNLEIEERFRYLVYNSIKRTNLDNVGYTQALDYPLYFNVNIEDYLTLDQNIKKFTLADDFDVSFSDLTDEKLENIKNILLDFYPSFYHFLASNIQLVNKKFGSLEFLDNNIEYLFSDNKVKQVFFDHSSYFNKINRYVLYYFLQLYRENKLDMLNKYLIRDVV